MIALITNLDQPARLIPVVATAWLALACTDPKPEREPVEWLVRLAGPLNDAITDVAVLGDGTIAITGWFDDESLLIGPEIEQPLGAPDARFVFVAKLNEQGTVQWMDLIKSSSRSTHASALAALPDGGVVIAGEFWGQGLVFGAGGPNEVTVIPNASQVPFAARYTADGTLVWATSWGYKWMHEDVTDVLVGKDEVIWVVTELEQNSIVVSQLDQTGELQFMVETGAGYFTAEAGEPALFADGSVLVAGNCAIKCQVWDPAGELQTWEGYSEMGYWNGFLSCVGPDGEIRWIRRIPGPERTGPKAARSRGDGNVLVAGEFEQLVELQMPDGSPIEQLLGASREIFFFEVTSDGDVAGGATLGGQGSQGVRSLLEAPGGGYLLAGWFDEWTLDPAVACLAADADGHLQAIGDRDAFLAFLDPGLEPEEVEVIGGEDYQYAFDLAFDGLYGWYATGTFTGATDFAVAGYDQAIPTSGENDGFLLRFER